MAQSVATAQIAGTVKDATGAAVPGAVVMATQTATAFTRATSTSANGSYTLSNLPIGPYTVRVTKTGFSTYTQTGIVLQVASNPTLNLVLKVGGVAQEVQVSADAAMIETHATGVGQVVGERAITELPLNGRQVTNLILLTGATAPAAGGDLNTNKNYPTQTISVAGGQINGIGFILDGASNNDPFNSLNLPLPFPDALQEFKVQTSALPAQYGAHASAAVNVVTKSGSNKYHGDLFEFVRNGAFNANNFFNNARGLPRDSLKRNQFGGTLGGPIRKDKLFFFGGYQGTITRSDPTDRSSTGVTQAMLGGDFTQFASALCQGKAVTLAAPFVNNKINPSQFNSASLAFLKHIPVSSDPCGTLNYGISQNSHDNQVIGRADYTVSSRQSMFFRYFNAHYVLPVGAGAAANILEANQVAQNDQTQTAAFGDNYTISPTAVNVFSLSLARTYAYRTIPPYPTPAELGIPVYSPIPGFMGISVSGAFSLGAGGTNPGHFNSTAPQIADDLTLVRGQHQIQVGVSWQHAIMNTVNNRPTNGAFSFGTSFTGLGITDFLLGDLSNFLQGNPDWENDRANFLGAYAQDSWRMSPRLTLSYGVRWSPLLQQYNWSKNRWVENFDLSKFNAGIRSGVYANAPAGLTFPGDPGYPGTQYSYDRKKDMDPRAGVIWDPTGSGRTSIRASWGLFFDQPQMFFYTRMSNNPPWGASISLPNPVGGFSNPWQGYPGGNPWPALAAVGPNMPFPQEGVYVNVPLQVKPTYVEQWDLSAQHQLGNSDAITVDYLGNETTHLWLGTELDPAVYSASCGVSLATYKKCLGTANQRRVLFEQNPAQGQFFSTIGSVDDGGTASYNALLVSEQHRLHSGLSFRANWTWSHCISDPATTELTGPTYDNPANRRMDRGNCGSDVRNVFNASMVGDAPWHWSGVAAALNDWRLSANFSSRWGLFSTATLGGPITDPALNGIGSRANTTANPLLVPMTTVGTQGNLQYVNPAAFTVPAFGTFGNAGVSTIPDPGFWNLDTALSRVVKLGESRSMELRWEMFNALNNVNLNAPSAGFGGSNVGQISSAGDARVMQFALKYAF